MATVENNSWFMNISAMPATRTLAQKENKKLFFSFYLHISAWISLK